MPTPTELDLQNAASRQAIAERMAQQYGEALALVVGAFGPGWAPTHQHRLVSHVEMERTRRDPAYQPQVAARVITARHEQTGERRHLALLPGQAPREVGGYEEGFGDMLLEPDFDAPEVLFGGKLIRRHRYGLCWSPFGRYAPASAEQLAARRERREEKTVEKEAERMPLFSEQIRREGYVKPPSRRKKR